MADEALAPAPPVRSEARETTWFLVKLLLFVLALRSLVFAPFSIPSESMLPRLLIGDYLIVAKWPYGFSKHSLPFSPNLGSGRIFASQPERGDVVVFKAPPTHDVDYIKRVIGLPGDLIQVKAGQLYLNGEAIQKKRIDDFLEPLTPNSACRKDENIRFRERASDGSFRCRYPRFVETLPGGKSYQVLDTTSFTYPTQEGVNPDETDVYTVPQGQLFLMGDNRDNSSDSRFPARKGGAIGIVPQENLVGRAWFGIFSTDGHAEWLKPWTWFTAARWERTGDGF